MTTHLKKANFASLAARAVLLVSLVLASFAHTVHAHPVNTPVGFDQRAYAAQFTLPDGTLPIICDKTGNGGTHHPSTIPCEFCSLADNTVLLSPFSQKCLRDCADDLSNPLSYSTLVFAKPLMGLHGASRAPPRV
ncbi:MAG: hypothetical protein AAF870_08905 [Pseudomonadota bacterium]